MSRFIDRRPQGRHKSAVNRQRFLRRFKAQIKRAVSDAINGRSITDIESGEKISLPSKDILEPNFHYGHGGKHEWVMPGNQNYIVGDKIKRPSKEQGGRGNQASNTGEGEDEFGFQISREEFLDLFFDDLELPNLIKTQIAKISAQKRIRAGVTQQGIPANINIIRSLRNAMGRRLAFKSAIKKHILDLEEKLQDLLKKESTTHPAVLEIKEEIAKLNRRLDHIPFLDPFDLRYNNRILQPRPTTQAVMFCLMDVSGSMDEAKKDIAKRFFILLYLFLTRNYERIELVFIRHHTSAKEVNEQEFFYSRETGGTVVSSALELMRDIMTHRYPTSEWNIYGAQASDGDNWNNDSPRCRDILMHDIMPHVQYFAYVEIMPRHHQSLWEVYQTVKETSKNFAMQHITETKDIYPVFRELFKRQHPAIPTVAEVSK